MPIRVVVVGLGLMGRAHLRAYQDDPAYDVAGIVTRSAPPPDLADLPHWTDLDQALLDAAPDLVSICTYTDTHVDYALKSIAAGADVFVEKPLATTATEAARVIDAARAAGRKLVIGHILQHHAHWQRFVHDAREMGGPFVFRISLNQPSEGDLWRKHQALMQTTSPILDAGVHYVDIMCQITDAAPVEVRGMGLRLADHLPDGMYNYSHIQITFADGSVGWHEAGWGPMFSDIAKYARDVVGPNGAVSLEDGGVLTRRSAALDAGGARLSPDQVTLMPPIDHAAMCAAQAAFLARAITEDFDLSAHQRSVLMALRICIAADESIRCGAPVRL
ncbi:Gfo/Idh/MocA family protein [Ketogulonicigenium vulgare]|uniref:Oxidoreductase protein n=1 Tax=Ketogulonicigenium vulgare (strain WSH-001) TaxID=759362 RepID=F9Y5K8_KETVW|nr:Gfo/Idh/MocA family oxidoreductase [Ketogulonicigenium vulgare]ADO42566.1 oxidoreductase protein [Ketogulonicigenium vulgare Y25]AEM40761.1 Oxidoreductase protein [Ketogulonicigenium vulgare WSH-001]ALJ80930.1 oxidoreductase [Ketogulonicigenium vulgare]ANW33701.1 oxidoreductase [Ketogulonicigenium vulgare]AOZ54479.1 oxidoreductase protein [Ketogulonicigenium vulgare]